MLDDLQASVEIQLQSIGDAEVMRLLSEDGIQTASTEQQQLLIEDGFVTASREQQPVQGNVQDGEDELMGTFNDSEPEDQQVPDTTEQAIFL